MVQGRPNALKSRTGLPEAGKVKYLHACLLTWRCRPNDRFGLNMRNIWYLCMFDLVHSSLSKVFRGTPKAGGMPLCDYFFTLTLLKHLYL